jgi:hypothetical protein
VSTAGSFPPSAEVIWRQKTKTSLTGIILQAFCKLFAAVGPLHFTRNLHNLDTFNSGLAKTSVQRQNLPRRNQAAVN